MPARQCNQGDGYGDGYGDSIVMGPKKLASVFVTEVQPIKKIEKNANLTCIILNV